MSQRRINELRIYEGEWNFFCPTDGCGGYSVEYCLSDYMCGRGDQFIHSDADRFLNTYAQYDSAWCPICKLPLQWVGYSGSSPISASLVSLVKTGHFMAAIVILAAITESAIQDLLWASLVDGGIEPGKANSIADGRLSRPIMVDLIKKLTDRPVVDISFPTRNLIAHGRGFLEDEEFYRAELKKQIAIIRNWVSKVLDARPPPNIMPTQVERWLLFMDSWAQWLVDYIDGAINPISP